MWDWLDELLAAGVDLGTTADAGYTWLPDLSWASGASLLGPSETTALDVLTAAATPQAGYLPIQGWLTNEAGDPSTYYWDPSTGAVLTGSQYQALGTTPTLPGWSPSLSTSPSTWDSLLRGLGQGVSNLGSYLGRGGTALSVTNVGDVNLPSPLPKMDTGLTSSPTVASPPALPTFTPMSAPVQGQSPMGPSGLSRLAAAQTAELSDPFTETRRRLARLYGFGGL